MKRRSFLKSVGVLLPSAMVVPFASRRSKVTNFDFSRKSSGRITVEVSSCFSSKSNASRVSVTKDSNMFKFFSHDELIDSCMKYLAEHGEDGINKNPNKFIDHLYEANDLLDRHLIGKAKEVADEMFYPGFKGFRPKFATAKEREEYGVMVIDSAVEINGLNKSS